jgi:hypothetical protein
LLELAVEDRDALAPGGEDVGVAGARRLHRGVAALRQRRAHRPAQRAPHRRAHPQAVAFCPPAGRGELPDETPVYPTHGFGSFCSSGGASGGSDSTMGLEKQRNDALLEQDEQAFVDKLVAGLTGYPAYYVHMGPRNAAGPDEPDLSPVSRVEPGRARAADQGRRVGRRPARKEGLRRPAPGGHRVHWDGQPVLHLHRRLSRVS